MVDKEKNPTDPACSFEPVMSIRYPPMRDLNKKIFKFLLCAGVPFARPISVEHERAKRRRAKIVKVLAWVLVLLLGGMFGAGYGGGVAGMQRLRTWIGIR
jgi:aldehyde dehydrogenase (NAD+)